MEYTKRKFLLELENYFKNFSKPYVEKEYTIGEVLYSLFLKVGDKKSLLAISDEDINKKLEKAQMFETEDI